ncbi:alpha/beta fold hydrolase [Streptomyces sp. NPDC050287]|uniref:alpha/beta fold hydrolase n=1 Tax=Streptomyces sp. NPDC050287 TaxID=3365608 RepID=UPI003790F236
MTLFPAFLAYEDKGADAARAPLVLVHGHPFDHTMWAPQIAEFSATRRVIAPDLRGYGASRTAPGTTGASGTPAAPAPGVTDFAQFAQDIGALLDDLKVDTFVLAGLSMGGQIAMDGYRQFGDRVRGLVLADTFPAAETPEGVTFRNTLADRLLAEGMRGYADEVLDKMVAPSAAAGVRAHVHRMMTSAPPEGAAAGLRARAGRPDYRELLTRVTAPALVVVGADDTYTPVSDAEAMHAALPDSTLRVIEGAAHLPNLERAAEFNEALREFLARVDGAS